MVKTPQSKREIHEAAIENHEEFLKASGKVLSVFERKGYPLRNRVSSITLSTSTSNNIHINSGEQLINTNNEHQNFVYQTNLPLTLTTNTSSMAPNQIAATSTVHSSYNEFESGPGNSLSHSLCEEEYPGSEISGEYNNTYYNIESSANESSDGTPSMRSFKCCQKPQLTEFGGFYGITTLMVIFPILFYYLHWCCLMKDCTLKLPNFEISIFNINVFIGDVFKGPVLGAYLAFIIGIFTFSIVMPGHYVRIYDRGAYKFTAFPISILFVLALVAAEYKKFKVCNFILQNYSCFSIYGTLISYTVSLWAYFSSYIKGQRYTTKTNPYGKTGNFLIDYALGRQINPKWIGLIDFKQVFHSVYLITTLLYAVSLIRQTVQFPWDNNIMYSTMQRTYDTLSLLSSTMLFIYILDSIFFEHHLASSFEMQGEGFGCLLLLRYAFSPYLLTAIPMYFFRHHSIVTLKYCYVLYVSSLLTLLGGLFLKRFSNRLKYKYRLNPKNRTFCKVDSIRTYQGRRLLLHSVWGMVRQPNYLGDIFALISMCIPLIYHFAWPPFLSICLLIIILIQRCYRVNARNSLLYNSSWIVYCNYVRYYLIPYVF